MTTDKQSTALQQLIQWLDPIHDSVIKKATELLEVERKQIEDSHDKANENWEKGYPTSITSGGVYFTNIFKQ